MPVSAAEFDKTCDVPEEAARTSIWRVRRPGRVRNLKHDETVFEAGRETKRETGRSAERNAPLAFEIGDGKLTLGG